MVLFILQAEKLAAVIKASGNEVEPYWPMLFAKALKGADVGALLSNIGQAAGPAAAGPAAAAEVAEVKEEKKEEAEAVDMGGLFGDEDDY